MFEYIDHAGKHALRADGVEFSLKKFLDCKNHYSGNVFLLASGASANDFPVLRYAKFPFVAMNGSILRLLDEQIQPLFYMCFDSRFPLNRPEIAIAGCKSAQHIAMNINSFYEVYSHDHSALTNKSLYLIERVNRYCHGKNISDRRFAWSVRNDSEMISQFSFIRKKVNRIGFSLNVNRGFYSASTIVYAALQLVHTLGFQNVFLIGVDLNKDSGRFYEQNMKSEVSMDKSVKNLSDVLPTKIDLDYDKFILPSFKILSNQFLKRQNYFKVFNLSLNSRLPSTVIPKISLDQLDQLLIQSEPFSRSDRNA
ncbi:MAG: hypothetical protein LBU76_09055 [Azoarcus sp.]|jgi:KDO transferase-3|nr:hypothetical protein [Azoarcus sp.]